MTEAKNLAKIVLNMTDNTLEIWSNDTPSRDYHLMVSSKLVYSKNGETEFVRTTFIRRMMQMMGEGYKFNSHITQK